jgi:hypothetical protein
MRKILLLLALIFAIAYGYHWYTGRLASTPEVATPVPVIRRATPAPLHPTSLQTHSLNSTGSVTPDPKANPLNAPHR